MKQLLLLLFILSTYIVSAQQDPVSFERTETRFRLHPNPVRDGFVFVETDHEGPKDIRIYDLFGKVVLQQRLVSQKLFLNALVPGVYMVQVRQQERIATKKLVIR
ncbi:T9SS type A sorting domain-containing protein [Robiginitalea sp.]|uniref:T9SS type A sorting domain-containing protein n=1 Tax=Robiginitalea sp. TaxID=1902411 RepID=UPI003C762358